jgi:hypothetical protein
MIGIARPYNNHYFLSIRWNIENDVFSQKKIENYFENFKRFSKKLEKCRVHFEEKNLNKCGKKGIKESSNYFK